MGRRNTRPKSTCRSLRRLRGACSDWRAVPICEVRADDLEKAVGNNLVPRGTPEMSLRTGRRLSAPLIPNRAAHCTRRASNRPPEAVPVFGVGYCRDRLQEYSGASYSFHISGQSINSSLVGPAHETDRCSSRVINAQSVGHMNEGHSKVHRYQFDITLILIQDDPIHSGLREGIRSRSALKQRFSKPSSNRTVATTEALRAFILEGLGKQPRN